MSKEVIVPVITPLNSENDINKSDISTLVKYLSNCSIKYKKSNKSFRSIY